MNKKKIKRRPAPAHLLALALVGCGGSDQPGSSRSSNVTVVPGTPAVIAAPSPTPTPVELAITAPPSATPVVSPTNKEGVGIVQAGDSIAAGHSTFGWNAIDHLGYDNRLVSVSNISVTGRLMSTGYVLRAAELFPHCQAPLTCILIVQQGTNDLGAGISARSLYYGYAVAFIQAAQAAGYYVVLATVLPRSDGAWNAAKESERLTYNNLVRANSAGADTVGDFAANSLVGDSADTRDNTYYADGLHLTVKGQVIMIDAYHAALSKLIANPRRLAAQ
jgi:lysophospholipase L1-like esterase